MGRVLKAGIYLTAIVWSGLAIITIRLYPAEWPMWLVLIGGSGIAAGGVSAFASDRFVSRVYLCVLLVPAAVMTFGLQSGQWLTLGLIIAIYLWFLLRQTQSHFEWYWKGVRDTITISELNTGLQEEANLFKSAIERSATPAALVTAEAGLVFVNDALCESLGYTRKELLAAKMEDLVPVFTPDVWTEAWARLKRRSFIQYETDHRHKSGRLIRVLSTSALVQFRGQEYNFAFATDITVLRQAEAERQDAQSQLHQSQKMEALGRLAGGIAHDFNNLLTVILGYASTQLAVLPLDHRFRQSNERIIKSVKRATDMVQQLLRISRQEVVTSSPLDVSTIVTDLEELLDRLTGDDVELVTHLEPGLQTVMADRSQMEQVLLNLVINASEAMPHGGVVTISTVMVESERPDAAGASMVRLSVADSGVGISDEVRSHLFEPFYTTKGTHGTGLGLATVNGIVSQLGGRIEVASEPGRGTVIDVTIPSSEQAETVVERRAVPQVAEPSADSKLAVDDDDESVLEFVRECLDASGYDVLGAPDGATAERLVDQSGGVDLLLTDVVMPGMNGRELAQRLSAKWPGMRVLYMTGYAPDRLLQSGVATEQVSLLQKPFTPGQLKLEVERALLTEPPPSGRPSLRAQAARIPSKPSRPDQTPRTFAAGTLLRRMRETLDATGHTSCGSQPLPPPGGRTVTDVQPADADLDRAGQSSRRNVKRPKAGTDPFTTTGAVWSSAIGAWGCRSASSES